MTPQRIQMSRQRPWRKDHPDAVIVDRRTRWGNPFELWETWGQWAAEDFDDEHRVMVSRAAATQAEARQIVVDAYRRALPSGLWDLPTVDEIREALAGRDLACWCPDGQPCHSDVLLELANGGVS